MQGSKKAVSPIPGWDGPLLTVIYTGFDYGSHGWGVGEQVTFRMTKVKIRMSRYPNLTVQEPSYVSVSFVGGPPHPKKERKKVIFLEFPTKTETRGTNSKKGNHTQMDTEGRNVLAALLVRLAGNDLNLTPIHQNHPKKKTTTDQQQKQLLTSNKRNATALG